MPGRGPQTFKKRQKEQQRKERQQEKMAKRLASKDDAPTSMVADEDDLIGLGLEPDLIASIPTDLPNQRGKNDDAE